MGIRERYRDGGNTLSMSVEITNFEMAKTGKKKANKDLLTGGHQASAEVFAETSFNCLSDNLQLGRGIYGVRNNRAR